jgi:hypothetical protein
MTQREKINQAKTHFVKGGDTSDVHKSKIVNLKSAIILSFESLT